MNSRVDFVRAWSLIILGEINGIKFEAEMLYVTDGGFCSYCLKVHQARYKFDHTIPEWKAFSVYPCSRYERKPVI